MIPRTRWIPSIHKAFPAATFSRLLFSGYLIALLSSQPHLAGLIVIRYVSIFIYNLAVRVDGLLWPARRQNDMPYHPPQKTAVIPSQNIFVSLNDHIILKTEQFK